MDNANLSRAKLSGATLIGASLRGADLTEVDLSKAILSWFEPTTKQWYSGIIFNKAKLCGAKLTKTCLKEVDLSEADLSNANLSEANLIRANLNRAILHHANLLKANLSETQMRLVDLSEANLSEADLHGANLYEANLNGATLNKTDLFGADLSGTSLSKKEVVDSSQIASIAKAYSYSPSIKEVVEAQLKLINNYYSSVLEQAQQSFRLAFGAAIVGLLFFITAISILLFRQPTNTLASTISLISGSLIEVISGINFYLYGRASNQLGTFHIRLDKTQHFLLADAICQSLEGTIQRATRAKLVDTIANMSAIATHKQETEVESSPPNSSRKSPTRTRTTKRI